MIAIILLVVFFAVMIGIGIWGMRKTSSLSDFFLGGRSIGPWVSAMAYGTSYFSAVLFIGFAGKFGWGLGLDVLWIILGNTFFGALAAWLVLGRRTRRMTQNLDVMTMPEYIQERYGAKSFKMVSAVIIFVFLLPYCASVFKGLGHLFEINFGMSYDVALLIMIGITGVYMILGGYFAITLTDFIQGIIMIIGSIAMIAIMVGEAGGVSKAIAAVQSEYAAHVPSGAQPGWLMVFSLVFMTSFGTWGLPQMVQKFYAIKSEGVIIKAAIVTTVFSLVIVFAAYFNGALSHVFYEAPKKSVQTTAQQAPQQKPAAVSTTTAGNETLKRTATTQAAATAQPSDTQVKTKPVVPNKDGKVDYDRIVPDMLSTHLPELLMAVILLLVLSASMSTLSSLVLVSASAVAIDMYKGHINPNISKENSVAMMRFLSGLFIIISFFIARYELSVIVTLMSLSWGAVAGTFMAPFLYGLYWKGATRTGIAAGMGTGLVLSISLFFILGPNNSPIASTIAMIAPFLVIPLVSIWTRKPDQALLAKAFDGIGRKR
ncbi:MAG TPA: sodium transporter [Spirochaetota bacterium]|nr:sodium transporter [Spirochaetota bacterium]HPN82086.1 sodium transporter [Spirochaetota bacterium]